MRGKKWWKVPEKENWAELIRNRPKAKRKPAELKRKPVKLIINRPSVFFSTRARHVIFNTNAPFFLSPLLLPLEPQRTRPLYFSPPSSPPKRPWQGNHSLSLPFTRNPTVALSLLTIYWAIISIFKTMVLLLPSPSSVLTYPEIRTGLFISLRAAIAFPIPGLFICPSFIVHH